VPTVLHEQVTVRRVERLSPSFVRVELGSPALADLGVDAPWYDQRIKLVGLHGLLARRRRHEVLAMS
jgi:NADPH-dependent ferric siderophore reductase